MRNRKSQNIGAEADKPEYMKKVIFLDIDGVLNTTEDRRINSDAVRNLSLLIRRTGAEVILHSGWRFWFDDKMNPLRMEAEQLERMMLSAEIRLSGKTPDMSDDETKKSETFSKVKASEIISWLSEHPKIEEWVVLDDLDLHHELIAEHQVMPNSMRGLTDKDIDKAEKILNLSQMKHLCDSICDKYFRVEDPTYLRETIYDGC